MEYNPFPAGTSRFAACRHRVPIGRACLRRTAAPAFRPARVPLAHMPMPTVLSAIEAKVEAGEALTDADASAILATPDIVTLGMLADEVRRRRHGDRATFVRVADVAMDGPAIGADFAAAGELRIVGAPPTLEAAAARVSAVAAQAHTTPGSAFSLADLEACCRRDGLSLADGLRRLRDAGLDLVAEAPIDRLAALEEGLVAARDAGVPVARLTVESDPDAESRIRLLRRLEHLSFAPGPLPVFAPLARRARSEEEAPTGYDDVKQIVLARLLLGTIPSIQVDWVRCGAKLAQVALTFGADDIDSVSPAAGLEQGPRRATLEEIRRNIRAAALTPVERNGRFEVIAP